MATNYGATFDLTISTVESIPLSESVTGTITVPNTTTSVVGAGTAFKTEIGYTGVTDLSSPSNSQSLGYLWDYTNGEYRVITDVVSDTLLFIEQPFTNSLAGASVKHIPPSRIKSLTYVCSAGGGTVNGMTLSAGESGGWAAEDYRNSILGAVLFDGTGGSINVEGSYV